MKKAALISVLMAMYLVTLAQVPESFNYQVVVREGTNPLTNQDVSFQMSILKGSSSGESQYSELHSANTGALGIVNLVIGNGTDKTGNIAAIDWGADTYFLKVEIDKTGGMAFVEMGTTQLLSVPYAFYSKKAGNGFTGSYNDLTDKPSLSVVAISGEYNDLSDKPTNLSDFTNDPGFLTEISIPGQNSGDLLYFNGTEWARIPKGTEGQILVMYNGLPSWQNIRITSPVISTMPVTNLGKNAVTLNAEINAAGGTAAVRFEYGTTTSYGNQVYSVPSSVSGSGYVSVSVNLTGLAEATKYHYRVIVEAVSGSQQSSDQIFITDYTPVTDLDGNVYHLINIGDQFWMKENLRVTKFNDGTPIDNVTDNTFYPSVVPAYCWYNNEVSYKEVYGALYNQAVIYPQYNGNRNVCPTGYHVPTESDAIVLRTFLGGNSIAGGKLKETGTMHWSSPNTGATDEYGFTATPGGYKVTSFGGIGQYAYYHLISGKRIDLFYNASNMTISDVAFSFYGHSIRCIKD